MNWNRPLSVLFVFMLVFVPVAAALSIPVTGDLPLTTNTGMTVILDQPGTFVGIGAFLANDTIDIDSGTVTAQSTGQLEIIDSDLAGDTVLEQMELTGTTALVDPSDKPQFDVSGSVQALTIKSGLAQDDGVTDLSYTSTGPFDVTLRNLDANQAYGVESSTGTPLGTGTTDANGTVTITLTQSGTFDGRLRTNEPPTIDGLAPDGVTFTQATQTLEATVDDPSFGIGAGDNIDVEFYRASNDSQIGSTQSITSASTLTQNVTLTQNGAFDWYVEATDKFGSTTQSPDQTFTLAEPAPDVIDVTPADGTEISEGPVDVALNITDTNLGNGDTVTVAFEKGDGTSLGTETLTTNGTASVNYSPLVGGTNEWKATVSDSFGNSFDTQTFSFRVPSDLTLRDVNDATDVIDDPGVDATVRFFEEEGDAVFPRSPTNGVVDMTGLPVDESFVVGVRDDSGTYLSRLTLIDTIFQQQSVYLINKSAVDTAVVRFEIEDRTGQFAGAGTELQIRRAINTTDSPADQEEYVVVAGDNVGSQLSFETELEQDVRYRITIQNAAGETRQLGAFTARLDQVVGLTISGIDVGVDVPEDEPVIETDIEETDTSQTLTFTYVDLAAETTEVNIVVRDAFNESRILDTASVDAPPNVSTFQHTTTLQGDDADVQAVYDVEYVRNGKTFTRTAAYGLNEFPVNLPLSDDWRQIFSVGFLMVLGGVFSVANARIGAIIIPGVAGLLYAIGFISGAATILGISLAMVLGVAYNLAFAGRGVIR